MKFIPIYLYMLQSPADFNYIPIIVIIVLVVLFLIGRELFCWYYKINERIELQKETNLLQKKTNHLLETLIGNKGIKSDSIITPDNKILETFDSIEVIVNSVDSIKIIENTIDIINIIGETIELEDLEIAKNDFSEEMIWEDAKKVCVSLGNGWRLPNKDELNTIYLNKDKIGRFASFSYWSSTDAGESYAWLQDFANGYQSYDGKNITFYVRAVRTIK